MSVLSVMRRENFVEYVDILMRSPGTRQWSNLNFIQIFRGINWKYFFENRVEAISFIHFLEYLVSSSVCTDTISRSITYTITYKCKIESTLRFFLHTQKNRFGSQGRIPQSNFLSLPPHPTVIAKLWDFSIETWISNIPSSCTYYSYLILQWSSYRDILSILRQLLKNIENVKNIIRNDNCVW